MTKEIKISLLDDLLVKSRHEYITYEEGAKRFGMAYWTFFDLAKKAKACKKYGRTVIVDLPLVEAYLEKHCLFKEENNIKKGENYMPSRKEIKNLNELIKTKNKKYVRYAEGAELFSMGIHSFQSLAKDAGAVRKVKGCVLVNLEKVEEFVESFAEEDY